MSDFTLLSRQISIKIKWRKFKIQMDLNEGGEIVLEMRNRFARYCEPEDTLDRLSEIFCIGTKL